MRYYCFMELEETLCLLLLRVAAKGVGGGVR
jgi:hypothetical protein